MRAHPNKTKNDTDISNLGAYERGGGLFVLLFTQINSRIFYSCYSSEYNKCVHNLCGF